jgi:hypothetical protein
MLKKLLSGTGALVTALWLIGMAQASPLSFFVPDSEVYLSVVPAEYTYSHHLDGFDPDMHVASLTLDIRDDSPADKRERVTVELYGDNYGTFEIIGTPIHFSVDPAVVQDGDLEVTLRRSKGDFFFYSSTLEAQVAQTPEPSTLLLLGSGLAGVVGVSLRRRQTGVVA